MRRNAAGVTRKSRSGSDEHRPDDQDGEHRRQRPQQDAAPTGAASGHVVRHGPTRRRSARPRADPTRSLRHSHHASRPNDSASSAATTHEGRDGDDAGQHAGSHRGQHDALDRGHDLAPVARRHRPAQPGQRPAGDPAEIAHRPDGEHPDAERAGDVHAEQEDQDRVDLHVEARPDRRHRPGVPGDPAVHRVQHQRHDGESGQRADRHGPDEGVARPAPRRRRRARTAPA